VYAGHHASVPIATGSTVQLNDMLSPIDSEALVDKFNVGMSITPPGGSVQQSSAMASFP